MPLIFLICSLIAFVTCLVCLVRKFKFIKIATLTHASVDNLKLVDKNENDYLAGLVSYKNLNGDDLTNISMSFSIESEIKVGDKVPMLYDPKKPTKIYKFNFNTLLGFLIFATTITLTLVVESALAFWYHLQLQ